MTRRLLVLTLLLLLAAFGSPIGSDRATAQGQPSVTMALLSQPAWTGKRRPLDLSFQATNTSTLGLSSLSVELLVLAPARSRSLYDLSIRSDPTPVIAAYPFPQEGTLEPGQSRTFRIRQDMEQLAQRGESALYPLRVELRSEDIPVGVLRTPTIFLIERPEVPLNLAWTWVLSETLQYDSNGIFQPGTIEADIGPGGRLDSLIQALTRRGKRAVDLVLSPTLLDQLKRMAGGYRIIRGGRLETVPRGSGGAADAERMLARVRQIVEDPNVELVAYPVGDASPSSLLRAGLGADLDKLTAEGRQVVTSILDRPIAADVSRPPRSELDTATMAKLTSSGVRTVLVDANFLGFQKFTTPPTARLTAGASSLTAVLPDPELDGLIRANQSDPRLAAQLALGQLAALWFELPGTPGRGAAMMFPEQLQAPAGFYPAMVSLIRASQWLRPTTASAFAATIPPQLRRQVPVRNYATFPSWYLARLENAKVSLAHLGKALHEAKPTIDRLKHDLLLAESGSFMANAAGGQEFLGSVDRVATRVYRKIGIATDVPLTLTSRRGSIPITLANSSGYTVTVVLQFITDRRLEFVGGDSRTVVLPPSDRTLLVGVKSLANGRIPIRVRLLTPGEVSPEVITERGLVVRSTAYNRVALFVTIGAALFLLAWWGRRFLPRRRT